MFERITKTWNPVVGCLHSCTYCWAKELAETKLKNTEKYKDGFKPKIARKELNKKFRKQFVFVSDMGELFGEWVPSEWIIEVIEAIKKSPTSYFLFLTKNPKRYFGFLDSYPQNVVLGATIETNRDYCYSEAPSVAERFDCMRKLPFRNRIVSIEPIMDFDMETMVQWMREIKPILVHVGYDNHEHRLLEPKLSKTLRLIEELEKFTRVKRLSLREAWR